MSILNTLAVTSDMWRSTGYDSADFAESFLDGFLGGGAAAAQGAVIWSLVSLILAVVGGILIYFLFVKKKSNPVNKFLVWMKSFLKFDKIFVEDIIKITYLVAALFITLSSFGLIGQNFLAFLLTLLLGNLGLRVAYEFAMIMIMIWSNTTKIKNKLTGEDEAGKKEVKK